MFGSSAVRLSPAALPLSWRVLVLMCRQPARQPGKKFLSESLTHPEALRNLWQQALT